jgi:hypothetical protein
MRNRREVIQTLAASTFAGAGLLGVPVRAQDTAPPGDPPDEEIAWVCPMHPSYTATAAGACPVCGMRLIQTKPYDTRDFRLELRTEPADVHPGQSITLLLTFLRPGSGEVVRDFEIVHTKPLHLFVISQDLEFFEHIHPQMRHDGTWSIETAVPRSGNYQVFCDFMPKGGSGQFLTALFSTADSADDLTAHAAHLVPDKTFRKSVDDMTATVSFDPRQPTSCQYAHLNFYLTDSKTGRPITDLQTYLGQFSHMLLMSEDLQYYVHSHPINLVVEQEDAAETPEYIIPPDADLDAIRGGPRVTFDALLPKPGVFRAWAQFQRNNQVRTIAFTFAVAEGSAEPVLL